MFHPDKDYRKRVADFLLVKIQNLETELFSMAEEIKVAKFEDSQVLTSTYQCKIKEMMQLTDALLTPIKERANPYNSLPLK